jgi:hypothetical protein
MSDRRTAAETVTGRPATRESVAALLAAGGCAGAVAGSPTDRLAVVLTLVGWLVVLAADRLDGRGRPRLARALTGVGVLAVLSGVGTLRAEGAALELVPDVASVVGVALVALGGLPLRRGWGRPLVAWGGVALVVGVVAEAVVLPVRPLSYLLALGAALLAWDLAEQGVSLGEHVGRRGATATVARRHVVGSATVGGLGVAVAAVAATVTGGVGPALPPLALAALVCVATLSLAALYS